MSLSKQTTQRLGKEYKEILQKEQTEMMIFFSGDNILECHFSFTGSPDSDFAEGIYHGKFIFPMDYPKNPPELYMMTRNGRFALNTKLCLTFTSFHPEEWTPTWTIESMIQALRVFMLTPGSGAVGAVESPSEARKQFAKESQMFECQMCGAKHQELMIQFEKNKKKQEKEKKKIDLENESVNDEVVSE